MRYRIIVLLICFGFACKAGSATDKKVYSLPEAVFKADSMYVGEQVKLTLTYKHPHHVEFLFPDSSFNFSPFEFVKKDFYKTSSDTATSTDSVVYTLTTFDLQPLYRLSLPVFVFENGDTLPLYSDDAEIYLKEMLPVVTQSDSLKVNTQYQVLDTRLNYPYLLIALVSILIIGGIIFVFFSKNIIKQYKIYLMKRDYNAFIKNFEKLNLEYQNLKSVELLEQILGLWKKYLQKLEKTPYTTLTTKEISKIFDYNQLTSSLQNFDRAIYGGYINENLLPSINYLLETATLRFNQKQKDIQNAGRISKS